MSSPSNDNDFIPSKRSRTEIPNSPVKSENERRQFLLDKEVLSNETEATRDEKIRFINFPDQSNNPVHFQACQKRLDRLLDKASDRICDTLPTEVQSFDSFLKKCPDWNNRTTSFVFHLDHPLVKDKSWVFVQRAQLSRLCYIHGPDLVQHYRVSMTSVVSVPMIDISKLIRDNFPSDQLYRHIFSNKGGGSCELLEYLLQPEAVIISSELLQENLKTYGPGLVSNFHVYEDFYDSEVSSHRGTGISRGDSKGRHSMVLIGHRREGDNDIYLLQNWWKSKQFVEVDYNYLKSCNATIHFVETDQTSIPDKFKTSGPCVYAENENLDKEEGVEYIEG